MVWTEFVMGRDVQESDETHHSPMLLGSAFEKLANDLFYKYGVCMSYICQESYFQKM